MREQAQTAFPKATRLATPLHTLLPRLPCARALSPNPAHLARAARLPVVLLVAAVELHQLRGVLVDVARRADQLLHERVAQIVRVLLQQLHLAPARADQLLCQLHP